MSRPADRLAHASDAAEIEPRHAFGSDLDHRREVVKGGADQLTDSLDCLWIRQDESRLWAKVLGLAQRHARRHAEGHRLLGGGDDVLVPETDDDRRPVEVGSSRQLQVPCQPTADARGETSSSDGMEISVTVAR